MTSQKVRSPQVYAHIGGVLYLIIIIAGLVDEVFVRGSLIVPGDVAATAYKIMGSELLFRGGIVGDLIMHVCDVPLTLILYVLLRPVSKNLSLLAAIFSLLQTAVLIANKLNLVAVLLVLGRDYRTAFDQHQIQGLVSLYLRLHEFGFGIGLIFFGVSCLVVGYLTYKSGYLPRALGVLHAIAGLSYLVNSFALLLSPALAGKMFPAILLPGFIGELAMCLWLLIKGVNVLKWDERNHMLDLGPPTATLHRLDPTEPGRDNLPR
jgi:hypothetical protein